MKKENKWERLIRNNKELSIMLHETRRENKTLSNKITRIHKQKKRLQNRLKEHLSKCDKCGKVLEEKTPSVLGVECELCIGCAKEGDS